jgi:hypothetical protein
VLPVILVLINTISIILTTTSSFSSPRLPSPPSPQTCLFVSHALRSMLSRCGGSLVSRRHVVTGILNGSRKLLANFLNHGLGIGVVWGCGCWITAISCLIKWGKFCERFWDGRFLIGSVGNPGLRSFRRVCWIMIFYGVNFQFLSMYISFEGVLGIYPLRNLEI